MYLELKGEICVAHARELKEVLLKALERGGPIQLDLHGVTDLDAAGVQLLLAARRTAQKRGQSFQVSAATRNELVDRVLALAGLAGQLDPVEGAHG